MMKKKVSSILCLLLVLFTFVACGGDAADDYGGKTKSELQSLAEQMVTTLQGMETDQMKEIKAAYDEQLAADPSDGDAKLYSDLISDWLGILPEIGEYKEFGKFTVDKAGKTITTTLEMKNSKRNARLIMVYNVRNMNVPTAINAELVYTMGETMGRAGLNVVMGMATVFGVLIVIAFAIYAFNIFPYLEKKKKEKTGNVEMPLTVPASASAVALANAEVSDSIVKRNEQPVEDDLELIAVITAAVAAALGTTDTDSFIVRSIKRRR